MESTLEAGGDGRLAAVVRERTGKLICPGLVGALLLAVEAEGGDACGHIAHIVHGITHHVRDVGDGAVEAGVVEALDIAPAVNDGALINVSYVALKAIIN